MMSLQWLALSLALLLQACTYVHKDIDVPVSADQASFEPGKTHYGEVLRALGPPERLSALSTGMVFLYEHIVLDERSFGIALPSPFDWLNLSSAKLTADREVLMFKFDRDGILRVQSFGQRRENLGSGLGTAPGASADSFVSSKDIDEDGGPHSWGARLLDSVPEMLNDEQSLETGEAGVQQRGETSNVGQHTLEMR